MTEERIKKLLITRYRGTALGYGMFFGLIGVALFVFGLAPFAIASFATGAFFWLNVTVSNHDEIKNIDNALLFKMYSDKTVLIKVMDELLNNPKYVYGGVNIS